MIENSFGQTVDWEAEFATELLRTLEEGAKKQEEAKANEEEAPVEPHPAIIKADFKISSIVVRPSVSSIL